MFVHVGQPLYSIKFSTFFPWAVGSISQRVTCRTSPNLELVLGDIKN